MFRALGSIAAGVALAFPASATIWIVDPSGGGDFTDIQAAVDAAADGDTIQVLDGTYAKVIVDGKGLTIEGIGNDVRIQGSLQILNTQPAQANVIAGIETTGLAGSSVPVSDGVGMSVDGCLGPVTARDCQFTGAKGSNGSSSITAGKVGLTGVLVTDSANVLLVRCTALGGDGGDVKFPDWNPAGGDGGIGIKATGSSVALCEVLATGGEGGEAGNWPGTGGDALRASSSAAQSVNGTYTGGTGGAAWDWSAAIGGEGGDAIHSAASALVTSFSDELIRGPGGFCFVSCPSGQPGKKVNKTGGGKVDILGPYCTPGVSASGCSALISSTGTPSASAPAGFLLHTSGVEGSKDGQFYFGANGKANNPWGNSSSTMCVAPPSKRGALLGGNGTSGACDGVFSYDLTQRWTQNPSQNPGAGAVVQAQFWFRDASSTSNQSTCLSEAIEFPVCP